MRTNIYVDGFNLYYGALKRNPDVRWLDLQALGNRLVGEHSVGRIRYFTAPVKGRANNPQQRQRQETYLRALRTIQPDVGIHFGSFQTKAKNFPRWDQLPKIKMVTVAKTEEKGSDVNLATYLLLDAFREDFESALVISNDSDLTEPIRVVRKELGFPVGIANPDPTTPRVLFGDFHRKIRKGLLKASQFPDTLQDADGTITRPPQWY